jgi:hypothetical protein
VSDGGQETQGRSQRVAMGASRATVTRKGRQRDRGPRCGVRQGNPAAKEDQADAPHLLTILQQRPQNPVPLRQDPSEVSAKLTTKPVRDVPLLVPERVAKHGCEDTWRNIRDDFKQIKLAQLLSPHGEVWQVTEPRERAAKRLKSLGIKNPPLLLRMD